MIKRSIAVTILTLASLFFAARFHGPKTGVALETDEPPEAAPVVRTIPPTTIPPTTLEQAPTITTTTTTPEPIFTLPTKPPPTTTTTIPLPEDGGGGTIFEGSRFRTRWGSIKVEIAVIDGTMVDVDIVMVPKGTKRSQALTLEHEPTFRYQALTRQSPRIDIISGATAIAEGYSWSLYSAMKDAGLWPLPEE
jgi:uncharacterized protein with FMN-binding domain